MGQTITIARDLTSVVFAGIPGVYQGGDSVNLTAAEYSALSGDTSQARLYTVGGSVADPVRPVVSQVSPGSSAARALFEANAYTDAATA